MLTNKLLAAAVLTFGLAGIALGQSGHEGHGAAPAASNARAPGHRAIGVVKATNAEKATVTIKHEPVPSLKWPAMTMAFRTHDRKLLEQLKPGVEVNFEFEQRGKDYVITAVNPGWGSCSADCPMGK